MPLEPAQRRVYKISELNRSAKMILEDAFAGIWVEGEISNFKFHSSGHMYLSLKDETAQISACFFSRYNQSVKFELKDGLKVLAFGRVSLYEQRGQYQFYIERVEPKGIGALQLAFEQLKAKLEKEGLFRPEHKKAIPKFPKTVGVVTSPTGAAIRDILNVMRRRFDGTQILIFPVRVQGDGSAAEVAAAIQAMNQRADIDVLIVGRGGGSLEDLWAFNEEIVARAVYASGIPIISAVGHEIDWTICDLVADLRAPTPSAAAELVVQNREEIEIRLMDFKNRMRKCMLHFMDIGRQRLRALESTYAFKQPLLLVEGFIQRVDELSRQLQNYLKARMTDKRGSFDNMAAKLHALSPLSILERGYSLTFTHDKQLLKDIRGIKAGDEIQSRLRHGTIYSKVTRIEKIGE